jgi:hypothetical protein
MKEIKPKKAGRHAIGKKNIKYFLNELFIEKAM